jgi:hypothetical protein
MPDIKIPEALYNRLQTIAVPFEDSTISVIEKLLNEYELHHLPAKAKKESERILDPEKPGSLKHTSVIQAVVNDQLISMPNWNKVSHEIHRLALYQGVAKEKLIELSPFNVTVGESDKQGFCFLADIDLSIQGVGAEVAWKYALKLAKHLSLPIQVIFEWRDKPSAAFPKEKGKLIWVPAN